MLVSGKIKKKSIHKFGSFTVCVLFRNDSCYALLRLAQQALVDLLEPLSLDYLLKNYPATKKYQDFCRNAYKTVNYYK